MAIITTPSKVATFLMRSNFFIVNSVSSIVFDDTYREYLPWWRTDTNVKETLNGSEFFKIDRSGSIRGTVKIGLAPAPFAPVFLYYRPCGLLICKTISDSSGFFHFDYLDKNSSEYFAVALRAPYNAQIFDKIVPIQL